MSAHETTDQDMYKMMGIVMGALCILAIIIGIVANIWGADKFDPTDKVMRNALEQRIEPVGRIRTAEMAEAEGEAVAATAAATQVASAEMTPKALYEGACAACHTAGVAGAPKYGDADAWAARMGGGVEALVASVINGKGAMPARGGSTYSDEDIARAVDYLLGEE